jgi:predicted enzyme related to lactoylglutathione lyase
MSDVLFAGMPVSDFAAALDWYTRLFGRAPDIPVHDTEVMWQVAAGGWLYVVADPARCGGGLVSIAVTDLDTALADLAARGVDPDAPVERMGDAGRKATFHDPEGNRVSLLEVAGTR